MILIKIFAIGFVLIALPLGYLIWYRNQLSRIAIFVITIYLLAMTALLYPVGTFLWSMTKVEEVFPKNCNSALELSKTYITRVYPEFYVVLLKNLFGVTPRYYFLSTIGICEYQNGNYENAVTSFEALLNDPISLDGNSRQKINDALTKAKAHLVEKKKTGDAL